MILSESESKEIISKIISRSGAEGISVNLTSSESGNVRFAANNITTCGSTKRVRINITSYFGKKSGSSEITSLNDDAISDGISLSEKLAKLSPDNDELMPLPEKDFDYLIVNETFPKTFNLLSSDRIKMIRYVMEKCREKELASAGFVENINRSNSVGNSNGLFAYHPSTEIDFSVTVRTPDGTGSSKIHRIYANVEDLDTKKLAEEVINKSERSRNPVEIDPGKYTAILESAAATDMIANLQWYMSRRSADEGRSFFSDKENGNKIGQKIANEKVTIYSDPDSHIAPSSPFTSEGMPIYKTTWIENGVLRNLPVDRFWAKKSSTEFIPFPSNIFMNGIQGRGLEDLVKETEYGIFVTRLWYIRSVDPKQILLTGLTRDGVFLIENGQITKPLKNFRFNESPVNILNNVLDMSDSRKMVGSETGNGKIVVPNLKVKDFNFSSISDAI